MGQYHDTFALGRLPQEKAEHFDHYALGGGAKLCEQYYTWQYSSTPYKHGDPPLTGPLLASMCAAAVALNVTFGDWQYRDIITVGDYAEGDDYGGEYAPLYGAPSHLVESHLVESVTAKTTAIMSETFGVTFEADGDSPWLDLRMPVDFDGRIQKAEAMHIPDWELVLTNQKEGPGGWKEYLEPTPFMSPPHPVASCILGGIWPVALLMTAVSDGLGGGDAHFEPHGRWAGGKFAWLTRNEAVRLEFEDVSKWAINQKEVRHHILRRDGDT